MRDQLIHETHGLLNLLQLPVGEILKFFTRWVPRMDCRQFFKFFRLSGWQGSQAWTIFQLNKNSFQIKQSLSAIFLL